MGRIQSIFTVTETDTTFLLIEYPTVVDDFTTLVVDGDKFQYSAIQMCLKTDMSTRIIETSDVVEKGVYFECSSGRCYFMRFPDLQHCS